LVSQLPHQHLLPEGLRAEDRQLPVKRHKHQLADAQGLQQAEFFRGEIQPQPGLTMQHLARMGPEAHHGRYWSSGRWMIGRWVSEYRIPWPELWARRHGHGGDHAAMAGVETVKTAEGNGRGPECVLG
jgi:hypothetical protein